MSIPKLHLLPIFLLFAVGLVVSGSAGGEESLQDQGSYKRARVGLSTPQELSRAKRRAAKLGEWTWTVIGNGTFGYDSNIHEGPGPGPSDPLDVPTTSSGVFNLGAKIETLRYFSKRDRLKMSFESTNHLATATSDVNDLDQQADFFYAHRFEDASVSLDGTIRHSNDAVTTSRGGKLVRDFENVTYKGKSGIRYRVTKSQTAKLSYGFKRKDYVNTPGKESLDWWRHGPKVGYAVDLGELVKVSSSYEFWMQNYDSEPAGLAFSGVEFPTNPVEEHFFHLVKADLEWNPNDEIEVVIEYKYRRKDDRFQEFESYSQHRGEISARYTPTDSLQFQINGSYARRNYDSRPGDPGALLVYARFEFEAVARYQLTRNLSVYSLYDLDDRDSNRSFGSTYRDYTRHVLLTGVTIAY